MSDFLSLLWTYFGDAFGYLGFLLRYIYIWGPFVFGVTLAAMFSRQRRADFLASKKKILLEIRIPKEHDKTPLAMELALNGVYHTSGESTWIDTKILGKTRGHFSLGIVSIEGNVFFYIWTWADLRQLVESNIYAQYPMVEINEVEDYTNLITFNTQKYITWGCEFDLTKPDPYPIKTYVDYGLDKVTDEEYKTDPISALIENWGHLKKGEFMWFQIIVRSHKTKLVPGTWFKQQKWTDEAQKIVNELMMRDPKTKRPVNGAEDEKVGPQLTEEKGTIAAIQRNVAKAGFECGMRGIYIAETKSFNSYNITALTGGLRQFASASLNGFKPNRGVTPFDWPWQDFRNIRQNRVMRKLIDAYKQRSYFHPPYKSPAFILSSEELATIFHFPGKVASTPTFERIQAVKAEPPANLPI